MNNPYACGSTTDPLPMETSARQLAFDALATAATIHTAGFLVACLASLTQRTHIEHRSFAINIVMACGTLLLFTIAMQPFAMKLCRFLSKFTTSSLRWTVCLVITLHLLGILTLSSIRIPVSRFPQVHPYLPLVGLIVITSFQCLTTAIAGMLIHAIRISSQFPMDVETTHEPSVWK